MEWIYSLWKLKMLILEDVYEEKIKTLEKMRKTSEGLHFLAERMNQMERSYDERLRYLSQLDKRIQEIRNERKGNLYLWAVHIKADLKQR